MIYTIGSLFAGIGGFDLGFERAGFRTAWQVEIDPYCRKVLAHNFPHAERYEDVRECGAHNLKRVDVICGGFPCQDISNAGLRAGIEGERSGLWSEFARIIGELRPSYVVVENVAALLGRGMGRVLGDLSTLGYNAEWKVISAADVGAPHLRERVWILAYPQRSERRKGEPGGDVVNRENAGWTQATSGTGTPGPNGGERSVADSESERCGEEGELRYNESPQWPTRNGQGMADAMRCGRRAQWSRRPVCEGEQLGQAEMADAGQSRLSQPERLPLLRAGGWEKGRAITECSCWATEPNVGRVAHGVPARVDRLKALGNAVVPQIPELIARQIMQVLAASPV